MKDHQTLTERKEIVKILDSSHHAFCKPISGKLSPPNLTKSSLHASPQPTTAPQTHATAPPSPNYRPGITELPGHPERRAQAPPRRNLPCPPPRAATEDNLYPIQFKGERRIKKEIYGRPSHEAKQRKGALPNSDVFKLIYPRTHYRSFYGPFYEPYEGQHEAATSFACGPIGLSLNRIWESAGRRCSEPERCASQKVLNWGRCCP